MMNWYKYWYYTIFFICDSFCRNRELSKNCAVALFSLCIYIIAALGNSLLYVFFDSDFMKNLCHVHFHLLLYIIIYLFNGFLFLPERRASKERGVYRRTNRQGKNLLFVLLPLAVFALYYYVLFNHTGRFLLI